MLVKWLNTPPTDKNDEAAFKQAVLSCASEGEKLNLDDVSSSYSLTLVEKVRVQKAQIILPITMKFQVWTVYSESENKDYYCIHQQVRLENSKLGCGPEDAEYWWNFHDGSYSNEGHGAYHKVDVSPTFGAESVNVESMSPSNSISGETSYTEGFSWSVDAGLYIGKDPSVNVGGSFGFDKSWTTSIPDLAMTAQFSPLKWTYEGIRPQSKFGFSGYSHTFVSNIQQTDCVLGQCWIWSVNNPKGSYSFTTNLAVELEMMSFAVYTFSTEERFFTERSTRNFKLQLPAPPRYVQTWNMECSPYSADVYRFLETNYTESWHPTFKLAASDKDSRSEIAAKIVSFKQEHNNRRSFWENSGMVGPYTFRWKLSGTPDGVYEDTYTFNVKQ